MKKIFFTVIIFVFVTSVTSAQNIGFIRNAQSRITANLDPVKAEWEKLLGEHNIPAVLVNFEIKSGADKVTGKTFYMLLATNRDKTVKVARALKLVNGNLLFLKGVEQPSGISMCTGCAMGCGPIILNGVWECDSDCDKTKECTKASLSQTN